MSVNPRGGNYGGVGYQREARTKEHVCGNCRWQGKGREDCPNNRRVRPDKRVTYMEPVDESD